MYTSIYEAREIVILHFYIQFSVFLNYSCEHNRRTTAISSVTTLTRLRVIVIQALGVL